VRERGLTLLRTRPWLFAASLSLSLLIANIVAEPDFGSPSNWPQELATLAPLVLVAMASTPAIVSGGGGLDLSVGPLAVMVNVVLVQSLLPHGIDTVWTCLPILIALGLAVGAINGILVSTLRYVPVIATLCTTFVITGVNLKLGATSRSAGDNWTQDLADKVGPIPGALILIAVPVVIWLTLSRTSYHRSLYGVGGNDVTAFSAGVNVAATRVVAYALGGLFAVFAGIALTALVQSSQATSTSYYILVGLTAVALGGTPLLGGRGGLTGAFCGASALYLIQTLLSALSVPPNWLNVVYGAMLLVGVVVGAAVTMHRPAQIEAAA
jgi:ribose transport system permease protein